MTNSGLASPPRAAPTRASPAAPPAPESPRPPVRPRGSYERVLAWSLLISAVAHLLVLLFSSFLSPPLEPNSGPQASPDAPVEPFGLQIVVAIPSEDAPDVPPVDDEPEEIPAVTPPPVTVPQSTLTPRPAVGPRSSEGSDRAGEPLRPGFRDPRLYAPSNEFPELQKTEHERYMEHLQARIDAVNDSLGVQAARNRETSDWTITDGSGDKWGLSPDGLHLGGFTIPRALLPAPAATGDNQSREAERERRRMREEIRNQEEARERDRTSEERIEAIRDRADEEREGGADD